MAQKDYEQAIAKLNSQTPMEIIADAKSEFVQIYNTIWQQGVREENKAGLSVYEKESRNFLLALKNNEYLARTTHFSIYIAFIDLAVNGLSLDAGSRAQCYLMTRNVAAGTDASGKKTYENRLSLVVSGYGELILRIRCGQIKYADNPVIVYADDTFETGEKDGRKFVNYTCRLPHTGRIIAVYMKITRNDGSYDYQVMYEEDWNRLAGYSAKNNSRYDAATRQRVEGSANELYHSGEKGQIDAGFLCAKLVKHAFRSYPRLRLGENTQLESQTEDNPQEELPKDIYGMGQKNDSFVEQPAQQPQGVVVEEIEDDTF